MCNSELAKPEQPDLRKAAEMALEALERGTTGLAIRAIPALRHALAQPEQETVNWLTMLQEAQAIVEGKYLFKRFIDGTPLSNDIAVWMLDFALKYAALAQPEQPDLRKAVEMAVPLLIGYREYSGDHRIANRCGEVLETLRQALAQPDKDSATELRRLHEVNQELLETLQNLCKAADNGHVASYSNLWDDARAAIAKANGESNE